MKDIIYLGNRYGQSHKLVRVPEEGDGVYRFETAQEWMPIYCSFEKWDDNAETVELSSLDSDGGPFISCGSVIEGNVISRLYFKKGVGYLVKF